MLLFAARCVSKTKDILFHLNQIHHLCIFFVNLHMHSEEKNSTFYSRWRFVFLLFLLVTLLTLAFHSFLAQFVSTLPFANQKKMLSLLFSSVKIIYICTLLFLLCLLPLSEWEEMFTLFSPRMTILPILTIEDINEMKAPTKRNTAKYMEEPRGTGGSSLWR